MVQVRGGRTSGERRIGIAVVGHLSEVLLDSPRQNCLHPPMMDTSDCRATWIGRHILPHEPVLRAHLNRWVPSDLQVDDVIQETYTKLVCLTSVSEIEFPKRYLFKTAHSIVCSHIRRAKIINIKALEELGELQFAADEPGPDVQASDRQQLRLLADLIDSLKEPGRQAIRLRVLDGLSHREIGRRLGISENAVQKSVAKSLAHLARCLGLGGYDRDGASGKKRPEEMPASHGCTGEERGY